MIYDFICHQYKANNESKYCLRNCTCTQTHSCHRGSCSVAPSAVILIGKEVGIKAYKDYILPLVVCKTALGGCMHLKPCVLAFMMPTSLISGILLS